MSLKNTGDLTRRSFVAFSALLLSGCGWHLRGVQNVPLESMCIDLGPNSAIGAMIKRNLRARTDIDIIEDKEKAEAIFKLISLNRGSSILAYNSEGQARIYSLILTARFTVTLQNGAEVIPPTTVSTSREMTWDERDYNGRAQEEQLLYQEMETSIIHLIVNRLSHLTAEQVELAKKVDG